ncbi:MAG: decarboxylase [Gammaproteobacteria bacterium]|nr:decarboxylase [Gammaproteobacteria bacterium]
MPFYIFKISPSEELEYIDSEEKYRSARDKVRALRSSAATGDKTTYRMIFASTVAEGEKLLSASEKDDKIIGDD